MIEQNNIDIGIIGAMQIEVETLCAAMTDATVEELGGIRFVVGTLRGKRVVCAKCGIGKVFAAMCTQAMILHYRPRVIINSGVAGTLSELCIGEVAVADAVVQHDMDTTAFGDPAGLISGLDIVYIPTDESVTSLLSDCVRAEGVTHMRGTVASGDRFVAAESEKDRIRTLFDTPEHHVLACEMEGAAVGQVCFVNGTPYSILRAISDGGNEQAFADYPTFLSTAAETASQIMLRFIDAFH